ncbi:unnamed protein product, partial [Thlaspi arvense]
FLVEYIEMEPSLTHVMLVPFPGQGHINPLLRLGKLIASKGLLVTFVTTHHSRAMWQEDASIQDHVVIPIGLGFIRFEFFGDVFVYNDVKNKTESGFLLSQLEVIGKREIKNLVKKYEKQPVRCLINSAFVLWELQIPSAVLWVHSSACLAAYYYYNHRLVDFPTKIDLKVNVEVPFIPLLLKHEEIPSFLHPSSTFAVYAELILEQFKYWPDSREPSSIVYISFGIVVHLKHEQVDEIAHGLLTYGCPSYGWFNLPWKETHALPRELEEKGKIVEWCPQERVLTHPAVACFLSHCGWNSTMEALTSGVPMVCLPQCGDQVTNVVYFVDVFKIRVRLSHGEADERIVPREKCNIPVSLNRPPIKSIML